MGAGFYIRGVFPARLAPRQSPTDNCCKLNGLHLPLSDRDTSVRIWDAASGREVTTFWGHKKGVTSVAVTPDDALRQSDTALNSPLWLADVLTQSGNAPAGVLHTPPHHCTQCSFPFATCQTVPSAFPRTLIWNKPEK